MKKQTLEIYEQAPQNFNPHVQVAACYIEIEGKILLLQRTSGKLEPQKWGVPAGKIEQGETPQQAAERELLEETGIRTLRFQYVAPLYIRKPDIDYVYHMFQVLLDKTPAVHLSKEHLNYQWASSKDLESLPLMDGAYEALQYYHNTLRKKGWNV